MIIIVATFAQALSGTADAVKIIGVLVVWRFIVSHFLFYQSLSLHSRLALVLAVTTLSALSFPQNSLPLKFVVA